GYRDLCSVRAIPKRGGYGTNYQRRRGDILGKMCLQPIGLTDTVGDAVDGETGEGVLATIGHIDALWVRARRRPCKAKFCVRENDRRGARHGDGRTRLTTATHRLNRSGSTANAGDVPVRNRRDGCITRRPRNGT